jgi:hypothetical protein
MASSRRCSQKASSTRLARGGEAGGEAGELLGVAVEGAPAGEAASFHGGILASGSRILPARAGGGEPDGRVGAA